MERVVGVKASGQMRWRGGERNNPGPQRNAQEKKRWNSTNWGSSKIFAVGISHQHKSHERKTIKTNGVVEAR